MLSLARSIAEYAPQEPEADHDNIDPQNITIIINVIITLLFTF